ncbi:hypothetical protein HA149_06270 [Prochlorococcus marinus XMU1406]|uniref:hypothetical protein n=1 Tax=Prochlorococcus marinus TaxID=1219 RepID=UPI001ADCD9FE|nr:hypothetical protein [Prochlorococcus marinus]MBO8206666.1 hypothetical protein [Prochlorococcus marinus XMU1406]MCR8544280.1 hypothetical protein [Prochlorococcus marinus XMU1427]
MKSSKLIFTFLISFFSINLSISNKVNADLVPISSKSQKFSAWCNFPKNKCKVTISNDRLIIDKHKGGKGVSFKDIFSYEKFEEEYQLSNYKKNPETVWIHQFEYQKNDGSFSTAKIMFNNEKSDARFSVAIDSSI